MAKQIVPKLDSGYGWLVTFACFSVCFIMQGLARAAGVLYVALIETYGASREAATMPFSLRYGVRNMIGPIVGIVAQRFGMRSAVVTGGILASIGGALCSIAPDVLWITILWGVVHGIGYGLCSTIHILILNQYFDKYKATSIALALTGDCFGTFVFPSLLEFLLLNYDIDGTFLILGAISLNIVPAGLLMRAPEWSKCAKEEISRKVISESINTCHITGTDNKGFKDTDNYVSRSDHTNLGKVVIPREKCNSLISNLRISSVKGHYINNVLSSYNSKNCSVFDADRQKEFQQYILSSKTGGVINLSDEVPHISFKNGTSRRRLGSIFSSSNTDENNYHTILENECLEKQVSNQDKLNLLEQIDTSENTVCNAPQNELISDITSESDIKNNVQIDEVTPSSVIIPCPSIMELENSSTLDEPPTKRKDSILDKILSLPTVVKCEIQDYKPLDESHLSQNSPPKTVFSTSKTLENSSALGSNLTFPMRKHSLSKLNSPPAMCNRIVENSTPVTSIKESQRPEYTNVTVQHEDSQVVVADSKESASALQKFLNLNLRPLMIVIGINLAAYSFILIAVFTVIVDYASDQGMEADLSKYVIISFSVADLFGRIGFGVVLDKRWIKLSLYSCINMAVMGISVLMIPFSSNYWYMMSCMAVFGSMQGGNAIVYPLLVEEYMNAGEENVALGCLCLYGGLIMLPLAPMIGFFRDTIGSYDGVFYTVGGICLLAGILWILEPLMLKIHHRMSKKAIK